VSDKGPAHDPPAARFRLDPAWAGRLAIGFVLAALATLVAVPAIIESDIEPLRMRAEDADEARSLVTRVQFALARQMSALQGYALAGDTLQPIHYQEARALERSAYPTLDSLAAGLSRTTGELVTRLHLLSDEWHGRINERELFQPYPAETQGIQAPDLVLYEATLDAARDLDGNLTSVARANREKAVAARDRGNALRLVMVLTALTAALLVGWFFRRMRVLRSEAAFRREEAEAALAEARRISESRERIVRGITHDIKNPLGAVDGYAELLELGVDGKLEPRQQKMVKGIRDSVAGALRLIADLLDYSRAESGTIELTREPEDSAGIAREAVEQYRGAAQSRGHSLDLQLPRYPLVAVTDRDRVSRIVGNLISNAVKYTTPPGRVVVSGDTRTGNGAPGPGRWIELRVSDSGPGVPEAERERIFGEFYRGETQTTSGHGLGLATSRRIARLLGGDITVADSETGGAAFSLWLPTENDSP
jgi:signal transduction histidine kinase